MQEKGGTPIVFPTIVITHPESWEACDKAIASLYMYDGVMFTSTNGVNGFFKRMETLSVSLEHLKSKMIFVVGDKTKETVERTGLKVTAVPEKFTAFDLSKMLEQENLKGKSFLFPRGNLGSNTLADNLKLLGATVDSVIVYHTQQPNTQYISEIRQLLLSGKIDVTTFTSPSTFKNFAAFFTSEEMKKIREHVHFAVIGPSTAKALQEIGIESDIIPSQSTVESLVNAISNYYNSRTPNLNTQTS